MTYRDTKKMRILSCLTLGVAMVMLLTSLMSTCLLVSASPSRTLTEINLMSDDRDYAWVDEQTETYTYDFTATEITAYSQDDKLATTSLRTNMIFDGSTLSCQPNKTFSFGSAIFLGDDFGIKGGQMSLDMSVTGGELSIGLRLAKKAATSSYPGIWFGFDGKGRMTVSEPSSGFSVAIDEVDSRRRWTFEDSVKKIKALCDGVLVCTVTYDAYTGGMTVQNAEGDVLGTLASSCVPTAGYLTLYANNMQGYVDNFSFTHDELTRTDGVENPPKLDYSTWVATDDRDRTTPVNVAKREEKQVGLFYFLCQTGDEDEIVKDNTHIYLTQGLDGLNAHLGDTDNQGSYFWAEPYFGYYRNTDEWVFRKHAYMLEAAGVDFIFLDFTNGATYPEGWQTLFDTWLAIRREGGSTPEICIFAHDSIGAVWGSLKGSLYSDAGFAKYGELFYQYQGKPLMLANMSKLPEAERAIVEEKFTVRDCWAWQDADGTWNWLQEYKGTSGNFRYVNGGPGRDANGNFEQLALCVGHHPTTSKGRSYLNTRFPTVINNDYGFSLDSGAGEGFAFQFEAIMHYDPNMVLITGWNEWVAGLNHSGNTGYDKFAGVAGTNFSFVDQFNTEYSRDAEPMRLRQGDKVGFGDNFMYQMASYIRQYKGTGNVTEATGQTPIDLSNLTTWDSVGPVYADNVGDTAWRSTQGFFGATTYVNATGRNDLVSAKVSQDAEYLYFLVNTAEDVVIDTDSAWMNLYLDIDNNSDTGWEGFDFVLNRARDGHYVAVESLADGWTGRHVGQALYTIEGNQMVIRLAKAVIGVNGKVSEFCFKWADNATKNGNIMEMMDLGDTAPNDRYAYLYVCPQTQGNDEVLFETYTLLTAEGVISGMRDETQILPGIQAEDEPTDGETQTKDEEIATSPEDATTEPQGDKTQDETTDEVVYVYSTRLKVLIVATGAVLGMCAFSIIALPTLIKKKGMER